MWMSEPMPVITRIITAESGSSSSVKLASKLPEWIQSNTRCDTTRESAGRPTRLQTDAADTASDASITPHAIAPEAVFESRRPSEAFSTKPTSGRSGISSSIDRGPGSRGVASRLPLQHRERVGVQRLLVAEQRDDDRQADRRFGGRHGHHEEH